MNEAQNIIQAQAKNFTSAQVIEIAKGKYHDGLVERFIDRKKELPGLNVDQFIAEEKAALKKFEEKCIGELTGAGLTQSTAQSIFNELGSVANNFKDPSLFQNKKQEIHKEKAQEETKQIDEIQKKNLPEKDSFGDALWKIMCPWDKKDHGEQLAPSLKDQARDMAKALRGFLSLDTTSEMKSAKPRLTPGLDKIAQERTGFQSQQHKH